MKSEKRDVMQTLKERMNIELENLFESGDFRQLENFITDDKKSADFITNLTGNFKFETPEQSSPLYSVAQVRARHSVISFLMGLVFKDFHDLDKKIENMLKVKERKDDFQKLWLMTSLNHDRGYTSQLISNESIDYEKKFKWYLLTDRYEDSKLGCLNGFANKYRSVFAYTYDEILAYDRYAKNFHTERYIDSGGVEIERVDHGVLGGAIVFNELTKEYLKGTQDNQGELLIIKSSSAAITQHNFFKSADAKRDEKYPLELEKLKSTSKFRIGAETPLLFLLSLVDTVECAKRLSKKENQNDYLQTLTVLEKIKVEISLESITINFSELRKVIYKKSTLANNLDEHLKCIEKLSYWTKTRVEEINPDELRIKYSR